MSDSEQKKTLTLKKPALGESTTPKRDAEKRNASGARAHRLARMNAETQKTQRNQSPEPSRYNERPRFSRDERRDGGSERPRFPRDDRRDGSSERPRFPRDERRDGSSERPRFPRDERRDGGSERPRFPRDERRDGSSERPRFPRDDRRDGGSERPRFPRDDRRDGGSERPRFPRDDRRDGSSERPRFPRDDRRDGGSERPRFPRDDRRDGGSERPRFPRDDRRDGSSERPRFPRDDRRDGGSERPRFPRDDRRDGGSERPRFPRDDRRDGGSERPRFPRDDRRDGGSERPRFPRDDRRDGSSERPRFPRDERRDGNSERPRFPRDDHRDGSSERPRFQRDDRRATHEGTASQRTPKAPVEHTQPKHDAFNPYRGRHKAFASCPRGMEEVLANELETIGLEQVRSARAGVHFESDWTGIQKANLYSRLATRILVQVANGPISTEDDIARLARKTPWESWFGPDHTLRVDTSAINSPMKSLQFCNLLVKDGICDRLRDLEGARPNIDTVRPDARVHLFLSESAATLYLDTSGESLFKRGWRLDKGEAPIRENLAAGLLALSQWTPETALLDPFCGSATILIEAAWIALDIAPGINRPFAFERLRHHNIDAWQALRQEATARIKTTAQAPIIGVESNPSTLESARRNLARAHVPADVITLLQGDACLEPCPAPSGMVLTNPPYGIRLEAEQELMTRWATHLKQNFSGWNVGVISADMDLPRNMRLKAKRRTPVFNGALDCRLFMFDLVSGSYQN